MTSFTNLESGYLAVCVCTLASCPVIYVQLLLLYSGSLVQLLLCTAVHNDFKMCIYGSLYGKKQ